MAGPSFILFKFDVDVAARGPDEGFRPVVQLEADGGDRCGMYGQRIRMEGLVGHGIPVGYLTGIAFEKAAVFGEAYLSAGALHQLDAEQPLEFGDVLADCRLGDAQLVGGGRKASALDYGKEYLDSGIFKHIANIRNIYYYLCAMKIGIMTAMDREYEMARKVLSNNSRHEIIPVHCGWGKVNSAVNAYKLINGYHPDCIISTGCAGGVAKDVHLLDVVVAAQVAYHDCWYGEPNEYGQVQGFPARFDADPVLLSAARSLDDPHLRFGLMASGDRFCSGPADNAVILGHFPEALACDMESGAISQVCYANSVPFLSVRVISDTAEEEDRLGQFEDFWSTVGSESFDILKRLVDAIPDSF